MKASDVFPSKYLSAEELDEDVTVTITGLSMEEMKDKGGATVQKPCIHFGELKKSLICNKTNWNLIAKQYGEESDGWAGKQVTLTTMDVDAFGDIVKAIRIKPALAQKVTPKEWAVETLDAESIAWLEDNGYLPKNTHPQHIVNLLKLSPFKPGDELDELWFIPYKAARAEGKQGKDAAQDADAAYFAVP